ncbi:T9SS type A sorting domain-containing protein [candidate division KSB1 bacterium]|nr:T9SS type A sorting domain-containing protein [candidate division KSB1 bacterium]
MGSLLIALTATCGFGQTLPTETSTLFSGSGNCVLCHSGGTGTLTTQAGRDISPPKLWRSTLMAHAAKDPLWQAKIAAEVKEHPELQTIIEDKCTTCHAPLGRTLAIFDGMNFYSLVAALQDPLSLDGVSCTLCHQIQNIDSGGASSFSGGYIILNLRQIYGPYPSPLANPMSNQVGFTPVFSEHIQKSELCATCHTLFTPFIDNQGNIGGYFPEQTPYLEWRNSVYPDSGRSCQSCHMPQVNESMRISLRPPAMAPLRSPISEHEFVGGNILLPQIFIAFPQDLSSSAPPAQWDSTLRKTRTLLKNRTARLTLEEILPGDTLQLTVRVENLTGHKFPTGFPSRLAWLHLRIDKPNGETFFESGKWAENGDIIGVDPELEPHHQIITDPNRVQIYQSVMQDVDNKPTYTLLRGASYAKDNRLPPSGFQNPTADIAVIGGASDDPDFNRFADGAQGSGSDRIIYRVPVPDPSLDLHVTVDLCYQTLSSPFAQDLLSYSNEPVTRFAEYYKQVDRTPAIVQSVSALVQATGIRSTSSLEKTHGLFQNYPNPFNSSTSIHFDLKNADTIQLHVYDLSGKNVRTIFSGYCSAGTKQMSWNGTDAENRPVPSGIYWICFVSSKNQKAIRVLLLR